MRFICLSRSLCVCVCVCVISCSISCSSCSCSCSWNVCLQGTGLYSVGFSLFSVWSSRKWKNCHSCLKTCVEQITDFVRTENKSIRSDMLQILLKNILQVLTSGIFPFPGLAALLRIKRQVYSIILTIVADKRDEIIHSRKHLRKVKCKNLHLGSELGISLSLSLSLYIYIYIYIYMGGGWLFICSLVSISMQLRTQRNINRNTHTYKYTFSHNNGVYESIYLCHTYSWQIRP